MLFVACDGVIDMFLIDRQSLGVQKSSISVDEKDRVIPKDDFAAKPGVRRRKMKGTLDAPSSAVTGGYEVALSRSHLSGLHLFLFTLYCLHTSVLY